MDPVLSVIIIVLIIFVIGFIIIGICGGGIGKSNIRYLIMRKEYNDGDISGSGNISGGGNSSTGSAGKRGSSSGLGAGGTKRRRENDTGGAPERNKPKSGAGPGGEKTDNGSGRDNSGSGSHSGTDRHERTDKDFNVSGSGSRSRPAAYVSWGLELVRDDRTVKRHIHIPDCTERDITVGSSSGCVIQINGYDGVCGEHIVIRCDKEGVFFEASDFCSETVIVNGCLVFNPEGIKNENEKLRRIRISRTYLREGMMIELGCAMLRAVLD